MPSYDLVDPDAYAEFLNTRPRGGGGGAVLGGLGPSPQAGAGASANTGASRGGLGGGTITNPQFNPQFTGGIGGIVFPVAGGSLGKSTGTTGSHIGNPRPGGRRHQGLDIFAPRGTPVLAAVSGTVVYSERRSPDGGSSGFGIAVQIRDASGNLHNFAHLAPGSEGIVKPGQQVTAGQLIGYVGNTGNAVGASPHLHYSINEGRSNLIDPYYFLRDGNAQTVSASQANSSGAPGSSAGTGPFAGTPGGAGQAPAAPMELPNDGVFLVVGNKRYIGYRPFNFKDGTQNEEWLLYEITGAVTNQLPTYQWPESHLSLSNVTLAGTMEELQGVGPNFEQYVNRLLDGLVGNNEARWDGHVQKVLAQAIARPDMSEAEFQNRLRQTPYYQQRTERQIEWNDLSEAERQARIDEVAADVVQHYFTYGGVNLPIGDKWVRHWASQIASGQMGMGEFVEGTLKPHFAKDPNSPQGRRIREEQESRLQRGVDIENLTADLRDIALNDWGFQMSGADLTKWAGYIAENKKSMKDFESTIEQWAKNMFPGIPANTTVRDYAQPYLQIFRQVLEKDAPLTNSHIQKALSQGFQNMTTNEFASYLKTLPDWEGTQNAVQELDQMASRAGQLMGFL